MFKFFVNVIFLVFVFYQLTVFSQNDAEVLLKKVQTKLNSIEDLSADFKQSIGEKLNLKGKIYFKQQDKLRFEMDNVLIISDG